MNVKYSFYESKNFPIKREVWNNGLWIYKKIIVPDVLYPAYSIRPTKETINKADIYIDATYIKGEIRINNDYFKVWKRSDIKNISEVLNSLWDFIEYLDNEHIITLNPDFKAKFFS